MHEELDAVWAVLLRSGGSSGGVAAVPTSAMQLVQYVQHLNLQAVLGQNSYGEMQNSQTV